jgi:hypothetical protein
VPGTPIVADERTWGIPVFATTQLAEVTTPSPEGEGFLEHA